jgi:D-glycerate 3-kinase
MQFEELASQLAQRYRAALEVRTPLLAALSGGQGAGKSTLAHHLVRAIEKSGASAFACSLDDFYLTRAARRALASHVHPLLVTRGVPGTHDLELLHATLDGLLGGMPTAVPVFDKSRDDRAPRTAWRTTARVDVVILEGWCLGARPEPEEALDVPINSLEAVEDPDGRFRRFVNASLRNDYSSLHARLQHLAFLAVPDMEAVLRWRTDQERALPPERRMSLEALVRFVAHYERVTRWMLRDMPGRSDATAVLGANHDVVRLDFRPPKAFI